MKLTVELSPRDDLIATVCGFAGEDRARESLVPGRERVAGCACAHGLELS